MERTIRNIKFTASKSSGEVSGILILPKNPKFLFVFAHGAGAGMKHYFMEKVSSYLADEGIATLRYNFPYTEKNKKSPDPAPILMETVRSAVKAALKTAGDIPILAGGKSMGGRMTSLAASDQNKTGMEKVKGIVFFGFPLHAPGKPSNERAEHLIKVNVPMLFLQGTRDKLADLELLKPVIKKLGDKATLYIIEGADHSFHLPKSLGGNDEEVLKELAKKVGEWGKDI
ncbi:MAG: alpha/beta hydrolase [Ignavibacteria bacterium RBG_16_34_14]|nr:MAG: alpha/beta hydrolase [Ignavibacteria bacterium RBG_16_34_14]